MGDMVVLGAIKLVFDIRVHENTDFDWEAFHAGFDEIRGVEPVFHCTFSEGQWVTFRFLIAHESDWEQALFDVKALAYECQITPEPY